MQQSSSCDMAMRCSILSSYIRSITRLQDAVRTCYL